MIQFKYTLDKSSKKFVCPKCNKKSFVKYIETETNDYLSDEFGRCDRQSSCQYFLTPEKEQATFQILNIDLITISIFLLRCSLNQNIINIIINCWWYSTFC